MTEHLRLKENALEWREVEGEVVALDLRRHTYLAINRTGATVWPALASGTTRDLLVSRLVERFAVSQEQAAADVDAFIAELEMHDLLDRGA